jgi:hypothetical protein
MAESDGGFEVLPRKAIPFEDGEGAFVIERNDAVHL